jgi:Domain of unknown function (DUF5664)
MERNGGFSGVRTEEEIFLMGVKVPPESKANTVNPKDLFGAKKVSISKLPSVAVLHGAHAMMDGADKYGAFNWRDKPVVASIYVDAAQRHLLAWFEGQEEAEDSGVHHLGHAIACCAILLDAQENCSMVDDRPGGDQLFSKVMKRLNGKIAGKHKPYPGEIIESK